MKRHPEGMRNTMNKIATIILSVILAITLGLTSCTTFNPPLTSRSIEPANPSITVTLDRLGVYFDHDPLKGRGEIYLGVVVTDGMTTEELHLPLQTEGVHHYSLNDNETQSIGLQVFSTNEVGDYLGVCVIAYEADGGDFEQLMYQRH